MPHRLSGSCKLLNFNKGHERFESRLAQNFIVFLDNFIKSNLLFNSCIKYRKVRREIKNSPCLIQHMISTLLAQHICHEDEASRKDRLQCDAIETHSVYCYCYCHYYLAQSGKKKSISKTL